MLASLYEPIDNQERYFQQGSIEGYETFPDQNVQKSFDVGGLHRFGIPDFDNESNSQMNNEHFSYIISILALPGLTDCKKIYNLAVFNIQCGQ